MGQRLMALVAVPLLVGLAGCGDRPDMEMDLGGEDLGPDRYSIVSEEGEVKLGLTDRFVYFALSDSTMAEIRAEMRSKSEEEGASGFFGGLLEKTVGKALGFRARIPVEEIRDIRWADGEMRVEFTDPDRRLGDDFQFNDRPMADAFAEEDVRRFAEEFRRVKESGGGGAEGSPEW